MTRFRRMTLGKSCAAMLTLGSLFQLGGCNFGEVTTTITLNGQELLITLVRGAIINPLDAYITQQIRNLFESE